MADWHDALKQLMTDAPADTTDNQSEQTAPQPTDDNIEKARLDIIFERKGRGGKTATIITGFTVDDDHVAEIAAKLKKKLGAGGSARGGEILIQGDRRNDVLKLLTDMGLKARII
jgi:translation initiation factor 1